MIRIFLQNISICFCFLLTILRLSGQDYHPPYENEEIGWKKIYHFEGYTKPISVDAKTYSPTMLSFADSVANWMQESYTPKGGLGDIKKYLTPKVNLYAERYNSAVPASVGARATTYHYLEKQNGAWIALNNLGIYWTIAANEIPMDHRLQGLNTSKICLFTIPRYDSEAIAANPGSDAAIEEKLFDLSGYPNVNRYNWYTKPGFNNQDQVMNVVILSKNNVFPFVHVTLGEIYSAIEAAIPVRFSEEKLSIEERYRGDDRNLGFYLSQLNEKFEKARQNLKIFRETNKSRLDDFAYCFYSSFTITDLENGKDVFIKSKYNKDWPVFKVDPKFTNSMQWTRPNWIMIKWFGSPMSLPYFRHMHQSIVNNFNFDYLFQFYFEPEKIKGQRYQPVSATLK